MMLSQDKGRRLFLFSLRAPQQSCSALAQCSRSTALASAHPFSKGSAAELLCPRPVLAQYRARFGSPFL